MNLGNLFKYFIERQGLPPNASFFQSEKFEAIHSKEPEAFTLFVGDRTLELLKSVGMGLHDLKDLPERVFQKCRELGFLYLTPIYCAIDVQERNRGSDASMQLARVLTPKPIDGKPVSRAILIYTDQLSKDLSELKVAANLSAMITGKQKESETQRMRMLQAKIKIALTHEMVHLFATDEHQGDRLQVLGLDLLELLTDSINVDIFQWDYLQTSDLEQIGFGHSAAYLMNLLEKENQLEGFKTPLKKLRQRAEVIIQECRTRLKIQTLH